MAEKTFAELGRVEAIRQLFEGTGYESFQEPLHLIAPAAGRVTTATKVLLEGVDFDLVYFPLKHLGYKSVLAVTGELYAALSKPQALSITLGVSAKLDYKQIEELWSGVVTAAKEHGYSALSLELQPSKNGLCISLAATGAATGAATEVATGTAPAINMARKEVRVCTPWRGEARSKDLVCVSGRLGAAYFGQQVLEHKPDELEKYKMMLAAYLKPELDPSVLQRLKEAGVVPSFGYFVTKGLSDAVLRLCRDSKLGVKIYAEKIPFEGNSFALGKELNIDPISAAMNGGDDYLLLYVIPSAQFETFSKEFKDFEVIGHLAQSDVGAVVVTPDGLEHPMTAQGW